MVQATLEADVREARAELARLEGAPPGGAAAAGPSPATSGAGAPDR